MIERQHSPSGARQGQEKHNQKKENNKIKRRSETHLWLWGGLEQQVWMQ